MRYLIKSLFKIFTLFCLVSVCCQGCCIFGGTKKKSSLKPSPTLLENPNQKGSKNDNSIQQLMDDFYAAAAAIYDPAIGTAFEDASEKKVEEDLKTSTEESTQEVQEISNKALAEDNKLSNEQRKQKEKELEQIFKKELEQILKDAGAKIERIAMELPRDKLAPMIKSRTRQEKLKKDIFDTMQKLKDLIEQPIKNNLQIEDHKLQPIFQKLIEASIKLIEADIKLIESDINYNKLYINNSHGNDYFQQLKLCTTNNFKKIALAFLECSTQEQKKHQSSLNAWLRLLESLIKEIKKYHQLTPNSYSEQVRQIVMETNEKVAKIVEVERPIEPEPK